TPRATTEYSRGSKASGGGSGDRQGRFSRGLRGAPRPPWGRVGVWLFIGAVAGAALLIVAEFTTLYVQQIGNATTDVGTGSHDTYALVPIAMLTVFLGFAVLRGGSRPALLAIGITGVVALLIALLGALPYTHANSL